jgi:hypothetical protein
MEAFVETITSTTATFEEKENVCQNLYTDLCKSEEARDALITPEYFSVVVRLIMENTDCILMGDFPSERRKFAELFIFLVSGTAAGNSDRQKAICSHNGLLPRLLLVLNQCDYSRMSRITASAIWKCIARVPTNAYQIWNMEGGTEILLNYFNRYYQEPPSPYDPSFDFSCYEALAGAGQTFCLPGNVRTPLLETYIYDTFLKVLNIFEDDNLCFRMSSEGLMGICNFFNCTVLLRPPVETDRYNLFCYVLCIMLFVTDIVMLLYCYVIMWH